MRPMIFGTPLLAGIAAIAFLVMPQTGNAQGPIVVLEYPGHTSASTPGLNQDNPFVYDPDHTASHRVQPDETLSHIITAYYAGSGLDLSVVQMAIVKKNKSAFVRGNPNFLYADKQLHLPSLNEMKDLVLGTKKNDMPGDRGGIQNEIFFIGG
ncbi:MAG: FimV family protein [Candidatus Puniceispirillaceae bacterium]